MAMRRPSRRESLGRVDRPQPKPKPTSSATSSARLARFQPTAQPPRARCLASSRRWALAKRAPHQSRPRAALLPQAVRPVARLDSNRCSSSSSTSRRSRAKAATTARAASPQEDSSRRTGCICACRLSRLRLSRATSRRLSPSQSVRDGGLSASPPLECSRARAADRNWLLVGFPGVDVNEWVAVNCESQWSRWPV